MHNHIIWYNLIMLIYFESTFLIKVEQLSPKLDLLNIKGFKETLNNVVTFYQFFIVSFGHKRFLNKIINNKVSYF